MVRVFAATHFHSISGIFVYMEIGVLEAAQRIGLSSRRVRALLENGRIPGRKVAGRWLIDESQLPSARPSSRPMSPRMAWAFVQLLSGEQPSVAATEASRLRAKRHQLQHSDDAPRLLRSWLISRASRVPIRAAQNDLEAMKNDPRVLLSGISDPRAELSSAGELEVYIARKDFGALTKDFMLSRHGQSNAIVHVSDAALPPEAPVGLVVADLADWDRPRENRRAAELVRSIGR